MKVAVCCKAVPLDVGPERVEVTGGQIKTTSRELFLNEVDEYAMESALALKKKYGVETWALTVGSLQSQEALYVALAKGFDQVRRINGDTDRPEVVAAGLSEALKELKPDLVLTGVQSVDWMGGEVGVFLSEALGMALGFAVVEIVELGDESVRVLKEIGGGRKAEIILKTPAVLCIQSGIQPVQYVSMMRRKKMRGIPIEVAGELRPGSLPASFVGLSAYHPVSVAAPQERTHAEMITGERPELISKVLEIIRKNV
jgi:electron transfer flavoprotein beta subunit